MDIDRKKVWKWLQEHSAIPQRCPVCERSNWVLLNKVWELGEFRAVPAAIAAFADVDRTPVVLPVVALACQGCGYTIFFNAFSVGAVEK